MMMAQDSTSNRPQLSADTVATLESALVHFLRDGEQASVEPALRRIAAEAREKRMTAEHLLIVLKDVWYELPALKRPGAVAQNATLQKIVTLCIRSYYSV